MDSDNKKKIEEKTAEQIKEERKERLKEYRRNYYRDYYKRNPDKKQYYLDLKASNNRKRYEEDDVFRNKQIEYSRFYRQCKKKERELEKEEISKRLAKLEMLENLLKNNIDFNNSSIAVKV